MKVLIGEARPSLDTYTLQGLMAAGHEVRRSQLGADLFHHLQQEPFDLVILGEEVSRGASIEGLRAAGLEMPVLLLKDSEQEDEYPASDLTERLGKPFSLSRLLACMNRLAGHKTVLHL